MKIIHFADSHLGLSAYSATTENGTNLKETLIYKNFLDGIDKIIKEKPDAVVHAGDLFQVVRPKTAALLTAVDGFRRLDEAGIPTYVVAGNHSMLRTTTMKGPFDIITEMRIPNLHIAATSARSLECGDCFFHLLPNQRFPEEYTTEFKKNIHCSQTHNNILISHGLAPGAIKQHSVSECELTSEILSDEFDYIALGHIHGRIRVADNAWYSGSQEYCTYGELNDIKGGLVFDTNTPTKEPAHLSLPNVPAIDIGTIDASTCGGTHELFAIASSMFERACDKQLKQSVIDSGLFSAQITIDNITKEASSVFDFSVFKELQAKCIDIKLKIKRAEVKEQIKSMVSHQSMNYSTEWNNFIDKSDITNAVKPVVKQRGETMVNAALASFMEEKYAD